MKRTLLIDTDSKVPSLPILKYSSHRKASGHDVELQRLKYNGYFRKGRQPKVIDASDYDEVRVSTIFTCNQEMVEVENCSDVKFGGTGIDLKTTLPPEVDIAPLDYSIYKDSFMEEYNNKKFPTEKKATNALNKIHKLLRTAYGFITRGCIRKCEFCFVWRKEGRIRLYNTIDQIFDPEKHDKAYFMDNNILAYDGHEEILQELIDKNIKSCFTQGLDIRLLNETNARLLHKLRYDGEYTFAFDNIDIQPVIEEKLKMMKEVGWTKRLRFYVFVSPDYSTLEEDVYRINWLRERGILPYIMREHKCWQHPDEKFYIDISAWCEQAKWFKKTTFSEFLTARESVNDERAKEHTHIFESLGNNVPWTKDGWRAA